jgi:tetratricopeptide (TPR) repeat protein
VSNVVPLQALENDRFLYMTTMGVAIGVAGAVAWSMKKASKTARETVWAVVGIAVMAGAAGTMVHNRVWHDNYTLWSAAAKEQPESYYALTNLGTYSFQRGEMKEAEEAWKSALRTDEKPSLAAENLSALYLGMRRLDEAEKMARLGWEYAPKLNATRLRMAMVLEQQGRVEEAMKWYKDALEGETMEPGEAYTANLQLARIMMTRSRGPEDTREACQYAEEAYRLHPDYETGQALVHAWRIGGKAEEAKKLATEWCEKLKPGDARRGEFERELRIIGEPPSQ